MRVEKEWTEKQLSNMQTIIDGLEEKREQLNKKKRIAAKGRKTATTRGAYRVKRILDYECLNRFFSKIGQINDDGCIEWFAKSMIQGYGVFSIGGIHILSHRIAWILENGLISNELEVCHKCDNPPCCNLDHLFLGTHADNAADMAMKGRGGSFPRPGEMNNLAKLTEDNVREIRSLANTGMTHKGIAHRFGVTRQNIGFIVNEKTWTHIL